MKSLSVLAGCVQGHRRASPSKAGLTSAYNFVRQTGPGVCVCLPESRHFVSTAVAQRWACFRTCAVFLALFDAVWQVTQLHIL